MLSVNYILLVHPDAVKGGSDGLGLGEVSSEELKLLSTIGDPRAALVAAFKGDVDTLKDLLSRNPSAVSILVTTGHCQIMYAVHTVPTVHTEHTIHNYTQFTHYTQYTRSCCSLNRRQLKGICNVHFRCV